MFLLVFVSVFEFVVDSMQNLHDDKTDGSSKSIKLQYFVILARQH